MKIDGAERVGTALSGTDLHRLESLFGCRDVGSAGVRVRDDAGLSAFLSHCDAFRDLAVSRLGPGARPVRAVLFDKCAETNWSLGWHQDRTIAVRQRFEVSGFGPWTLKSGIPHVEPPFSYIANMVTLRAHLDACGADNGPLRIAPGSHRLGRIPVNKINDVVRQCGEVSCLASRGDVWVCSTAIVHASEASRCSSRRRLLMVDYSAAELPNPLACAGI